MKKENTLEIHNVSTLYAMDAPGRVSDHKLLSFVTRPQDWGDPRWTYLHYEIHRTDPETLSRFSGDVEKVIHHVHLWTDMEHRHEHELTQALGVCFGMLTIPGVDPRACGRSHLVFGLDEWRSAWGDEPPSFQPDDDVIDFDNFLIADFGPDPDPGENEQGQI